MEKMRIITADAAVVGSGAAGYNAAVRLKQEGKKKVVLITEGVNCGTSRNTGSDKQTYYKLGLGGDSPDSVRRMAEDLFAGGSVDGDNALCEAALSARCFFQLCELGVPFPVNRYGEYVGYKTDHDPCARATSAGPLTSRFMTEALEKRAGQLGMPVYDGLLAVEILLEKGEVCGLLCLDLKNGGFTAVHCAHVILATGGPAGIYADSVYPAGHTGSTSLAIRAGAALQNLTEWQYGLASVSPRWNVSGTYMQVLPRFVSVDEAGCEREFLAEYFEDIYEALSAVFLKGYQWPFDSRKVQAGSSVIDLLVYRECVLRKRRVYLDYQKNPFGLEEIEFEKLAAEAHVYLEKAGACFGTPIRRLQKMNQPAIDLYRSKGRDLEKEYLEIALCAQHHNGGIAVDAWWQTSVPGLFAVGECAGTHGVSRPGGSALNAGQAGSLRAALYCGASERELMDAAAFEALARERLDAHEAFCGRVCGAVGNAGEGTGERSGQNGANVAWQSGRERSAVGNVAEKLACARRRMSDCGGAIRDCAAMKRALEEIGQELLRLEDRCQELSALETRVIAADESQLKLAYQLKDTLIGQSAVLTAMIDFAEKTGVTRGSALYTDMSGELREGLEELFRFRPEDLLDRETEASAAEGHISDSRRFVQELRFDENSGGYRIEWRPVRPIPDADDFFENVWRGYRENGNIY